MTVPDRSSIIWLVPGLRSSIWTVPTIPEKEGTHRGYLNVDTLAFLESFNDFSIPRIFGLRV